MYTLFILLFVFVVFIYLLCQQLKFQSGHLRDVGVGRRQTQEGQDQIPIKTLIILGSGGHTREILSMTNSLSTEMFSPRFYITSSSDPLSGEKAVQMESARDSNPSEYKIESIYRARAVGQSFVTSVFTTAWSTVQSLYFITRIRPQLILCNGPGVCVPLCLIAHIFRLLGLLKVKIIFIESICRVESLSLSGKILTLAADEFLVQWEEMERKFPGTKYIGRIC